MNNTTGECENISSGCEVWELPYGVTVLALLCLSVNIVVSLLINALLMLILQHSPSLKTPPNSHLLNICINNILLCISMLLAMVGVNVNGVNDVTYEVSQALSSTQLFIVYNSLLQYWGTFACIGYYRKKTIKEPSLTLRIRRQIVSRSIAGNWIISLLLSTTCSLIYRGTSNIMETTLDPFRKDYYQSKMSTFAAEQMTIILFILGVFLVGFVTIFSSYYSIFKTLNVTGTFAKNRVTPFQRAPSLASDVADLTVPCGRSYHPADAPAGRPFTVSQKSNDTLVVHYQKCDNTLAFEDILALENPIRAANLVKQDHQKRQLQMTLSNGSTTSTRSRCPDFSDISLGADLERFQMMKNSSALRNQFLRRDRDSLSSAIRNSLVMFCAYLVCSLPLIFCSFPRALAAVPPQNRVITLLVCRLLFFVNAPVYPTWYLLFSKRVRKCLRRMSDTMLLRLNVRR
ncbi:uncharacterized protein LOC124133365 [Haliotis rufescens]|uniref:uncharacterized protein LOC124133365 n=1 Tax=Haliotis rufescens TaxID=6454 RepID=UPI00201EE863|nr:uncharacterized protein LOC124133365 [Haliotis rufescens]XP_046353703.2 uncharacterized protein LOC124133365 [Haliotis rufescens]XP_048257115.1 uncharacterized protein LOC124133365 [Haliotis rufescens]